MMHFSDIIGQQVATRTLKRAMETGRVSHAYLFSGPEGVGKMTLAAVFAAALNCSGENREDLEPCGKCKSCTLMEAGTHPDFQVISPEGGYTKIETMRELRRTAQFAPVLGRWKINIIERAETLREDAASAILKTLEDSPPYLVMILLTRNPGIILPTIRSRCQLVRFFSASQGELIPALIERTGAAPDLASLVAAYAEGRPGRALSFIKDESFTKVRDEIIAVAEQLSSGSTLPFLRLSERFMAAGGEGSDVEPAEETPAVHHPQAQMTAVAAEVETEAESEEGYETMRQPKNRAGSQRAEIGWLLDAAILWYRDLLNLKLRGKDAPLINADRRSQIVAQASRYSGPESLVLALQILARARRAIEGNANVQLIVEAAMLRLASLACR